jgi:chaperonin cofactor prefoldin
MEELLKTLLAILSGGLIWEGFKFFYPDLKQFITSRNNAKKAFYESLDPILKSASELYGKLESLSKEDFSTFINTSNSNAIDPEHNQKYILYLFAQLFAQLEYLRLQSQYTSLSKITKGYQLLRFIETIESRKYRILDRSVQRIIGECLISKKDQKFRIMTLKEFLETLDNRTETLTIWIKQLDKLLNSVNDKEKRQLILRFGVIVAALIDHFDPSCKTVRRRKIYVNKLNPKSKILIKENLTSHYLPFLKKKEMYYS